MKTLYIICLLMMTSIATQAQHPSFFYNYKGQFYLDTSLTITNAQYKAWNNSEYALVSIFSKIDYPPILVENGIKSKSPVIVSFFCDTIDIKEIKFLNDTGYFANAIKNSLKQQGKEISARLKGTNRSSSDKEYVGKYYIAFNFELFELDEYLKTHRAIPITRPSVRLISRGEF
jgi:hypothetical protein